MQDALVVGDEIITAGGLYAVIREIDHDRLRIEIAPGVLARSTGERSPPWPRTSKTTPRMTSRKLEITEPAAEPENDAQPRSLSPLDVAPVPPLLIALILLALAGVASLAVPSSPFHKSLRKGLDLQGGLEVVLKASRRRGTS